MRKKLLSLLTLGHFASDFYPGMFSPLLPLILARHGLSLAMAGVFIMVLQIFCNLSQPFVGVLNDNRPMKSFLWAGLIVSGLPFCFLLNIGNLPVMIGALAISGIGVGMYHPVAVVAVGLIAKEERRGISMALFSSGGMVAFMSAPLLVVFIVKIIGEQFMPLVILPAIIAAAGFVLNHEMVVSEQHHMTVREWFGALKESKRELFLLWLISSLRAVVHVLLTSFLPLLSIARGSSWATGAYFLSASLFAGIVGMLLGGHLSDIYGRKKMMAVTLCIASPALFAFLHTEGFLSTIFLLIGMGALSSTIPVNIILAQLAAPRHTSMASSLVMGLSFALGAVAAWPFGVIADRIGIEAAMEIIFIIPVLGGLIVFLLRKE